MIEDESPRTMNDIYTDSSTGVNDGTQHLSPPVTSTSSASYPIPAAINHIDITEQMYSMIDDGQVPAPPSSSSTAPNSLYTPRSIEEDYCVILERNQTSSAKSSNSRYQCRFCEFEFIGGPQKIRVHLTGKRENGTRLSRCEKVPEDVKALMESRMKPVKDPRHTGGVYDDQDPGATGLQPRNAEEQHVIVLSRSGNSRSKGSNSAYKCNYCRFKFIGGPQKIRVHLTGQPEGGTKIAKCQLVPPEIVMLLMNGRKKKSSMQSNELMPPAIPTQLPHSLYAMPMISAHYIPFPSFFHHAQHPMMPLDWTSHQHQHQHQN